MHVGIRQQASAEAGKKAGAGIVAERVRYHRAV